MKDYKFTLADMANPQKGTIDIVFGAGGGTQLKLGHRLIGMRRWG